MVDGQLNIPYQHGRSHKSDVVAVRLDRRHQQLMSLAQTVRTLPRAIMWVGASKPR
jgi:hypothetical protein